MSPVAQVLTAVRERLADPRAWVQGTWAGIRTHGGYVVPFNQHRDMARANCWCLSEAITLAMPELVRGGLDTWTELRSDVERELLNTLDELGAVDANGKRWAVIYQWNDDGLTSHADVMALLLLTLGRVAPGVLPNSGSDRP